MKKLEDLYIVCALFEMLVFYQNCMIYIVLILFYVLIEYYDVENKWKHPTTYK